MRILQRSTIATLAVCITGTVMAADPSVQWTAGLLSVKARGQTLGSILHEIAHQTGVVIEGSNGLTKPPVSGVDRVPLFDALRVLLSGHNYMILGGAQSEAMHVVVLSGLTPGPALPQAFELPSTLERSFADDDPAVRIEAVEQLGELTDARSLVLIRRALADPSEAVRAVANEALNTRQSHSGDGEKRPER